jgi:ribosomal protein S27E
MTAGTTGEAYDLDKLRETSRREFTREPKAMNRATTVSAQASYAHLREVTPMSIEAEISCLMCGRGLADIVSGRLVIRPNSRPNSRPNLVRSNGRVRCGHCGGRIHKEPMLSLQPR